MLKHVKTTGIKEKNQPTLTHEISAPIKNSNLKSVKLPDLSQYRESKIVQITGDLQANNFPENSNLEKFNITNANSEILSKYDQKQLFKAGDSNSNPSFFQNADALQVKFALGQGILEKMGYTKIFRIENELSVQETTKKITLLSNFKN